MLDTLAGEGVLLLDSKQSAFLALGRFPSVYKLIQVLRRLNLLVTNHSFANSPSTMSTFGTLPTQARWQNNNEDMLDTRGVHDFSVEGGQRGRERRHLDQQQEARQRSPPPKRLKRAPQYPPVPPPVAGFRREMDVSVELTEANGNPKGGSNKLVGVLRIFRGEKAAHIGSIIMTLVDHANVFLLRHWKFTPSQVAATSAGNNQIHMEVVKPKTQKIDKFQLKVEQRKGDELLALLQELGVKESLMEVTPV